MKLYLLLAPHLVALSIILILMLIFIGSAFIPPTPNPHHRRWSPLLETETPTIIATQPPTSTPQSNHSSRVVPDWEATCTVLVVTAVYRSDYIPWDCWLATPWAAWNSGTPVPTVNPFPN